MATIDVPEIVVPPALRAAFDEAVAAYASIDDAEVAALETESPSGLSAGRDWDVLRAAAASAVEASGYVVVRGLGLDEGRSLLVLSTAVGTGFATYAPRKVVKRFQMSPWTKELSHTLAAGSFHTDGNVSARPPVATAMQCEREDPGGSAYAELRVAHLPRLLERLDTVGTAGASALAFLMEEDVPMASPRSAAVWTGRLISEGRIRYHPESLRVANDRLGRSSERLEAILSTIHQAALDVAPPFHTRVGEVLMVSNTTALHYRGECSVRFVRFPIEFEARSLLVLHRSGSNG